jgi:hypothetical protein
MATLMDLLMRRQDRGYDVKPGGPSAIDMLLQREKRGYATSAPPPAAPLPEGMFEQLNRSVSMRQAPYSQMGMGYNTPREMMPPSGGGVSAQTVNQLKSVKSLPGYEGEGSPIYNSFRSLPGYEGEGPQMASPRQAAASAGAQQFGPVNMNVIKGLNQYAQMNNPQAYADQFAGGDLSKIRARTYRDEEGNAYNDYYVKGLLGG